VWDFNAIRKINIFIWVFCDLITSLDYDYNNNENHDTQAGQRDFDEKTILSTIRSFVPDLDTHIQERIDKTVADIEASIARAQHNPLLAHEAKEALIKNIQIMESYQIQELRTKLFTMQVWTFLPVLSKRRIKYIKTTMEPKLLHVLIITRGRSDDPSPIDSKWNRRKQEHLVAELQI
jgi:hypothetical protein